MRFSIQAEIWNSVEKQPIIEPDSPVAKPHNGTAAGNPRPLTNTPAGLACVKGIPKRSSSLAFFLPRM